MLSSAHAIFRFIVKEALWNFRINMEGKSLEIVKLINIKEVT